MLKNFTLKYLLLLIYLSSASNATGATAQGHSVSAPSGEEKTVPSAEPTLEIKEKNNKDNRLEFEDSMRSFQLHVDKIFDDMSKGFIYTIPSSVSSFSYSLRPSIDVASSDKNYTITVEVPGMEDKDLNLKLINHSLVIEGEKKLEKEQKDKNLHTSERSYGSFQRVLSLPKDANEENIEAKIKNGLLTIIIPKKEIVEEKPKIIKINKE